MCVGGDVQPLGAGQRNPNDTWGLVLWDHSNSGIENGLVSWTLSINAVPEPVTLALIVFAALAGGIKLLSWRRQRG